ncbi:hypothetical protein GH733_011209 [Mirounga leonina]|nr:hypothetical protein GH733_011209 [Mirounga leonina]
MSSPLPAAPHLHCVQHHSRRAAPTQTPRDPMLACDIPLDAPHALGVREDSFSYFMSPTLHFRHDAVGSLGLGHKPHPTLVPTQALLLSPDILPMHQLTAIGCHSGSSNSSYHDLNSQTPPSPVSPPSPFHDWHHPVALTPARSLAHITDLGFLLLAPVFMTPNPVSSPLFSPPPTSHLPDAKAPSSALSHPKIPPPHTHTLAPPM